MKVIENIQLEPYEELLRLMYAKKTTTPIAFMIAFRKKD